MLLSSLLLLSLSVLAVASPQSPHRNTPSRPSTRQSSKIKCSRVQTRREIRDLSRPERERLFNAIKKLNSGSRPTLYDRFTKYHLDGQNIFHGGPMFLPWHRMMLKRFEMELQQIDPAVVLAYWDWSKDANRPEKSAVLSGNYVGGNTNGNCLQEGAFAGWHVQYPQPHCLMRRYANGDKGTGAFTGATVLDALIDQSSRYDQFRQQMETVPHGHPHIGIGGDMSEMHSPNDPIFYLHHGFIDKMWADWQMEHPARKTDYYGTNRNGASAKMSDSLPYLGARIRDAMTTQELCYRYIEPGKGSTNARLRRRQNDDGGEDDQGEDDQGQDDQGQDDQGQDDQGEDNGDDGSGDDNGGDEENDDDQVPYHHRTHGEPDYDMDAPTHLGDLAQTKHDYDLPKFDKKSALCASEVLDEEIVMPEPVPQCWIKMNGYCEKTLRHIEASYKCIVRKVNKEVRKRLGCKKPNGEEANHDDKPPSYNQGQKDDHVDKQYTPPSPTQPSPPAPGRSDGKAPDKASKEPGNPYDGASDGAQGAGGGGSQPVVYLPKSSGKGYDK
jgi:tyrosinase